MRKSEVYIYFFRSVLASSLVCILVFLSGMAASATDTIRGFTLHPERGCFDIQYVENGARWMKDVSASFVCDGNRYSTRDLQSDGVSILSTEGVFGKGKTLLWKFSSSAANLVFGLELTSYEVGNWITVNGWVENKGRDKVTVNAVHLLEIDNGALLGGSWENYRVLSGSTDKLEWAGEALQQSGSRLSSREVMGVWNSENNTGAVIGFSIRHAWGNIAFTRKGEGVKLSAEVPLDVDIRRREKVYAEAVHLIADSVLVAMEDLLDRTGQEVLARVDGTSYGGWCSWYGFNPFIDNDVTEDVVVGFARAAKEEEQLPLQVMLLDDGYFTLPGDWGTLRPFFPSGMKYLVQEVKENGLMPGIWVAPSLVHQRSEIIRQHPEWVDRNADGNPRVSLGNWGGETHSFDISHPEVLRHIDSLFRVICGTWGYKYLKLDFNMEPGPHRYDRSITPFQAMRNMYRVIRKAVGPEVFIANCSGSPHPPSVGIAQAGRVGPDVNPNWKSVIEGCRKSLLHIPFHRRWWVNDPDCLNMRVNGSQLTTAELQTHITANYMGGGYIMFSDSLAKLPEERKRMLGQALPSYGMGAQAIDYMTAPGPGIPSILNLPVEKAYEPKYTVTAVFNWADTAADIRLEFDALGLDTTKAYHVFDFWTDKYAGIIGKGLDIRSMEPHSCKLLAIRPEVRGQIQVVSTDLHLLQGTMEITGINNMNTSPFDKAKSEIWIKIRPVSLRSGKIILAAGKGLRIASLQGGTGYLQPRKDGLWDLHVSDLKDEAAILLRER